MKLNSVIKKTFKYVMNKVGLAIYIFNHKLYKQQI